MKNIPPIKAVMTPFPYWIGIVDSVRNARALMAEHDLQHLPVMDKGELVGVLRLKDLRAADELAPVGDVCPGEAYVVHLSEPLDRVLFQMAEKHYDSALVVKEGKLAGIFTVTDACRSYGGLLRQLFPRDHDDDAA